MDFITALGYAGLALGYALLTIASAIVLIILLRYA
jgi:hypothetical protein